MATIIGYAIPLSTPMPGINQSADHTYVRTADGRGVWGCWGSSNNGRAICSGTGSSKRSDCYSQPWGTSGIIYGVTGVCHQTANRILYSASAIVSQAHAYWLSSLVYGTYGRDPVVWAGQLFRCAWTNGDKVTRSVTKAAAIEPSHAAPNAEDLTYTKEIFALYKKLINAPGDYAAKRDSSSLLLNQELAIAIEIKLHGKLAAAKKSSALEIQRALHADNDKLVDALYSESVTPNTYATRANDLFNEHFKKLSTELGAVGFEKLFAVPPDKNYLIINPDVMTKPYKNIDF